MLDKLGEIDVTQQAENLAPWWDQIEQWRSVKCLDYEQGTEIIKPQKVIEAVYKHTNGDAFISSDVGQHQMFAALYYPFAKPRQWINSGGLGTMGFGLPAAMGKCLVGEPFTVHKGHKRIFDYVTDTARTVANISENFIAGEVYNVGSNEGWEITIEQLASAKTPKPAATSVGVLPI